MKLWKSKFENEATSKIEDLEEENLKLKVQFEDFDHNSNDLQAKMMKLKKLNSKLSNDLKDHISELENANRKVDEKNKKIKEINYFTENQKQSIEELNHFIESLKKENIESLSEMCKYKQENEIMMNQMEILRSDNSSLQSKIHNQNNEIQSLDSRLLELDINKKRSESEKDDLILANDDLQFALEKLESRAKTLETEKDEMKKGIVKFKVENFKTLFVLEFDSKIEDKDAESSRQIHQLQICLDFERSKIETEKKSNNEQKRFEK